jgi:microcystin degradation protein MlrC
MLDLHGNVTSEMVESADALFALRTFPHLDRANTGWRAMATLSRAIAGETNPMTRAERPPVAVYVSQQHTESGPMTEVMALARECEEREGVVSMSVLLGVYHADVPEIGVSVLVVPTATRASRRRRRRRCGGGSSDGTTVLRALSNQGVNGAGYALLCDPESVTMCHDARPGE